MNDELREQLEEMLAEFENAVASENTMKERRSILRDSGITRDQQYDAEQVSTRAYFKILEFFDGLMEGDKS